MKVFRVRPPGTLVSLLPLLPLVALLAAPLGAAEREAARVTILFTSDLHAHLMPFDEARGRAADIGLARAAARARAIRKREKHVLLLDGGDTIQGSAAGYLHARPPREAAVPAGPHPTIAAMNAAGYDAMTVGNHEFNYGLAVLRRAEGAARFPWLSANIRNEDGSPAFRETLVKVVGGVRVGVIGLTTPGIPTWEPEANRPGLRFEDPVAAAKRLVPELRGKERCDLVVAAFHSGIEVDLETGEPNGSEAENRVAALAQEVPGIDLILSGHTHRKIPLARISGVPVVQPGRWGEVLARVDVSFGRKDGRLAVANVASELLPSDAGVAPDPEVARIAAPWDRAVAEYLDSKVAESAGAFPAAAARLGDSALLDLLHDVQLEATGADLSLASLLPGWSYEGLPAGTVRVRDLFALYPYENQLVVVEVTGEAVKGVLERAAAFYREAAWEGGRLVLAPDPDIPTYNFDTLAGATYRIDPTAPLGARVKELSVRGRPVRPEERFTLAVNSYRAQGGGGYASLRGVPVLRVFGDEMRNLLIERLRERKTIAPVADGNWYLGADVVWRPR